MKYEQLILLWPCHGLDDFPTHHEGDDALGLLATWSAMWHPALLASAQAMPTWYRASNPPESIANRLIVVPGLSETELPTDFAERAREQGAVLIRNQLDREVILAAALSQLDGGAGGIDPSVTADFLALGYCFLQVELLTRQMRYTSNLDQFHFEKQVVAAATAALAGDAQTAREKLGACFDQLAEERTHYYPAEAFLLDVTMVAPTTLGASLRTEVSQSTGTNLLLSAALSELMAQNEPETVQVLRQALEENRLGILGGEHTERRTPLLSCESWLAELRRGLASYEAILGSRPAVFARRRFGLAPMLPQVLQRLGFQAALHATFEEGAFPEGSQIKIRWEGCDGTALDAIARPPADATKPATFLRFSLRMGESMDMDHVATMGLAHWPGNTSPWYEDLRRVAKYCPALGKFVTFEEYFRCTALSTQLQRFQADQYRSPYLRQAVVSGQSDPISNLVRYWRRRAVGEAAQSAQALVGFLTGRAPRSGDSAELEQWLSAVDQAEEGGGQDDLDSRLDSALQTATQQFANALPRAQTPAKGGYLLVNPHTFVRRVGLELPDLAALPAVTRPVYAATEKRGTKYVVVDVPPMGYAWVAPAGTSASAAQTEPLLADECLLRNEFFEALIDPKTGGLRVLRQYNSRTNRLSQQLVFHWPGSAPVQSGSGRQGSDRGGNNSVMVCDGVQTTVATPVLGEIVSHGRLVDRQGKPLAGFRQTYRLWRGSRVLQLRVEFEPQVECEADPWESYFAARFAWANETAELYRSVNETRQPTTAKRFEAPLYFDIVDGETRTTILNGGIPFHRRQGLRMLDSLLIVRGERCRDFQFGIGFDVKQPLQESLNLLAPLPRVFQAAPPPTPSESGWLFHLDARNILATHWEPLGDETSLAGFRVRLLEIFGRPAKATLSTFRPVASARKINHLGQSEGDCSLQDGRIQVQLAAHQWVELEAKW